MQRHLDLNEHKEFAAPEGRTVEWHVSTGLTDYNNAVAAMEERVARIRDGSASELIWLVEHPPLYTAGTSARAEDLLDDGRFPVYRTGRGGQYTYHGPGQRVIYIMLDLQARDGDVRAFVNRIERWLISTLADFGVSAAVREGRVGVWVPRTFEGSRGPEHEDKIAAIGIRVRRGVTFHGASLNVCPELAHFGGIVPCGIPGGETGFGVTSLSDLGCNASLAAVDDALKASFAATFGPWLDAFSPTPVSQD